MLLKDGTDDDLLCTLQTNMVPLICKALTAVVELLYSFDNSNMCFRLPEIINYFEPTMMNMKQTLFN